MRIQDGLRIAAICAAFSAGCEEEDGKPSAQDAGSSSPDATTPSDSGPADTGSTPPADTGTGSDAGGSNDSGGGSGSDSGSDAAQGSGGSVITSSTGPWTVFPNPYGDGGANPATGIQGSASATRSGDAGMTVALSVSGLPAARDFGSHIHKLTCAEMSAGGHYQHSPALAADAAVTDPAYANPSNEVWLDFKTSDAGSAMSSASVNWIPPDGGANAVIVHDLRTTDGGLAGARLACLPLPF